MIAGVTMNPLDARRIQNKLPAHNRAVAPERRVIQSTVNEDLIESKIEEYENRKIDELERIEADQDQ